LRCAPIRNALVIENSFTTIRPNFVDHLLARPLIVTFAVSATTEVIYDNFRAIFRHHHGNPAPNATASTGDDYNLIFHHVHIRMLRHFELISLPLLFARRTAAYAGDLHEAI
jgi:hypothetical protein